jgi:hypothetical protein
LLAEYAYNSLQKPSMAHNMEQRGKEERSGLYIAIASTTLSASPTFVGNQYRILYSPMVFDAAPTQPAPPITGTLEIDGITTAPNATLPAIAPMAVPLIVPQQ